MSPEEPREQPPFPTWGPVGGAGLVTCVDAPHPHLPPAESILPRRHLTHRPPRLHFLHIRGLGAFKNQQLRSPYLLTSLLSVTRRLHPRLLRAQDGGARPRAQRRLRWPRESQAPPRPCQRSRPGLDPRCPFRPKPGTGCADDSRWQTPRARGTKDGTGRLTLLRVRAYSQQGHPRKMCFPSLCT